jgi:hypothetical protein
MFGFEAPKAELLCQWRVTMLERLRSEFRTRARREQTKAAGGLNNDKKLIALQYRGNPQSWQQPYALIANHPSGV